MNRFINLSREQNRFYRGTNHAPLVADLFLLFMGETLWCLFPMISRLILLMLLTLHPNIWMIFKTLKTRILAIW